MRFRLTTLLAATFTAALLLGANFHKREIDLSDLSSMVQRNRWAERGSFESLNFAQGFPVVVYAVVTNSDGQYRLIAWEPWAILNNAIIGLVAVAAVAFVVEWLERKRARQNQGRLKA